MPFALLLALAALAGGTLLTYLYDPEAPPLVRLCEGAPTGLAALGLVGFVVASFAGLSPASLAASGLVVASPLLLLLRPRWRVRVREDARGAGRVLRRALTLREGAGVLLFYAAASVVLWLVFAQSVYRTPEGVFTGADNNIGDLPFHVAIVSGFAYGENFPPEHPEYAGTRLTYPFIADFLTAAFVRAGATLEGAMFWQDFLLALAFVALLHRWARELTGDPSAALLTPALVLFNGGLGFWQFFKTWAAGGRGLFESLRRLDGNYTMIGDTYRWANVVTFLLLPQRGLLLGFPLAMIVWTLWWKAINKEKVKRQKAKAEAAGGERRKGKGKKLKRAAVAESRQASASPSASTAMARASSSLPAENVAFYKWPLAFPEFLAAGIIAGLLPLVHAHSFVVMMGMGGCLAIIFGLLRLGGEDARGQEARGAWRGWAVFFTAALVVAAPQLYFATHRSDVRAASFFGWEFGWDHGKNSVVAFWLKNTGLFIPLLAAALLWRGRGGERLVPRRLLLFSVPFALCFVVPNLLKLSPWIWDNVKVLFYWWVAASPLVALLVVSIWRRGVVWKVAAAGLVAVLVLAGALDVWRVASGSMRQKVFTREGLAFAELVRRETPPRSVILNAPTYNHPVFLTGRRSLMGYAGHLYSHGLTYAAREEAVKRVYAGAPDADAILRQYGVDYAVVGPLERQGEGMGRGVGLAADSLFQRYRKVGEVGGYSLYKTSP